LIIKSSYRHEKQLKELKDKGYFIMADGTKSSEHAVAGKKKKGSRSAKKEHKKRGLGAALNEKSGEKGKKAAAKGGKTKKSEDDLDIESDSEEQEQSEAQESD
jgi:hypothetical protein